MKAAFYHGTNKRLGGVLDVLVKTATHGPISHCECVFSDGLCGSSSAIDGGVRLKKIDLDRNQWWVYETPWADEVTARAWFEARLGKRSDPFGLLGFVTPPTKRPRDKYFCSETMAAALFGLADPWRFDPNQMFGMVMARNKENGLLK